MPTTAPAATSLLPAGAPAFLEGFAAVHRAMRRDTARLPTAVAAATTAAQAGALQRWFAKFEREVVHHHEREDDIVWVDLVERDPSFGNHLGQLEQDHDELDVAMSSVRTSLGTLASGATGGATRAAAVDAATHLALLLHDHLEREEAVAFPAIAAAYTAEEYAALEQRLMQATPFRSIAFELPWAAEGLPADVLAELIAGLPVPIRLANRFVFGPAYRRLAAPIRSVA